MAKMPVGAPRSVPDPAGDAYDEMIKNERTKQAAKEAGATPADSVGHPGLVESLIPVWGSGREAVADYQEGDYVGAAINGVLAASDLFLVGSAAKGLAKGGFYGLRGIAKGAPEAYGWKKVRKWMGKQGYLAERQHGHHWAIPQKGWGEGVPDWIKNQPWNIKPMPDAVTHWRIEHRVGALPRFNPVERYWYGTPAWSKVGAGAAIGHPLAAEEAQQER